MYNVLYKNHAEKVYHVFSRDNAGKTHHAPHTTKFDFKKKNAFSYIYFIWLRMIQWMENNRTLFQCCTYVPIIIEHTHTHLHKIQPHTHHTPLHTHSIIHTKIACHTRRKCYTKRNCHNINTYHSYVATYSENVGLYKDKYTRTKSKFGETKTWNVVINISQNKERCNQQMEAIKTYYHRMLFKWSMRCLAGSSIRKRFS